MCDGIGIHRTLFVIKNNLWVNIMCLFLVRNGVSLVVLGWLAQKLPETLLSSLLILQEKYWNYRCTHLCLTCVLPDMSGHHTCTAP